MIENKKKYKLSDFKYQLPKKFIAQKPNRKRENSKMMVLNRENKTITHKKFVNIVDYFQKNDLLIVNDTKVFPARLFATKDRTDAKVEIFLLRELGDRLWEVLVKPARKVRIGNKLIFNNKKVNFSLKMMHGVNKLAIIMFLIGVVFLIIKRII